MDLWKVLRLVALVQLKLISKTDRTRFPKGGRLPLPFEWVLQFQVLTASPSRRNEGLLSPSLQFQLLQKSTWKDGCESLKKKKKKAETLHTCLSNPSSAVFSAHWVWADSGAGKRKQTSDKIPKVKMSLLLMGSWARLVSEQLAWPSPDPTLRITICSFCSQLPGKKSKQQSNAIDALSFNFYIFKFSTA